MCADGPRNTRDFKLVRRAREWIQYLKQVEMLAKQDQNSNAKQHVADWNKKKMHVHPFFFSRWPCRTKVLKA